MITTTLIILAKLLDVIWQNVNKSKLPCHLICCYDSSAFFSIIKPIALMMKNNSSRIHVFFKFLLSMIVADVLILLYFDKTDNDDVGIARIFLLILRNR